ncbi:MAG: CBS domain-containing protein [Planctomycetota bacterium]|nr:CBS domain-containing protein [Planctomycetota bacterium]
MQVSELLAKRGGELYAIGPEASVSELVEILNRRHIGALPVVDGAQRLLGVVSERDVLRKAYDAERRGFDCQKKVADIMRPRAKMPVATMTTRLREAFQLMNEFRTRHLVVVDEDDRALACISVRDLVRCLLEMLESENRELQNFMYGY